MKIHEIEKRLAEIEKALADAKNRLPAHSVKPPIMHQLFELEDEREIVLKQLASAKLSE